MSDESTKPSWFQQIKPHAILANIVVSGVVGMLGWFVSGQMTAIKLAAANEQVSALTRTVDELKADSQTDRSELTALRGTDRSDRDAILTCRQERISIESQAQLLPGLRAQIDAVSAELAKAKADVSLAQALSGLLEQERDLNRRVLNRASVISNGSALPGDETRDPEIRQMTIERQDLAQHINVLMASHPSLGTTSGEVIQASEAPSMADIFH